MMKRTMMRMLTTIGMSRWPALLWPRAAMVTRRMRSPRRLHTSLRHQQQQQAASTWHLCTTTTATRCHPGTTRAASTSPHHRRMTGPRQPDQQAVPLWVFRLHPLRHQQ
ncbi:hypothetical protein COO60DRAFT_1553543 [Scenedesmus sp. NREL 46B-D3]|nr:hypothetical protein COO60DRAFT_1553543 [Scenedesmus sp. NREL 46B-D3]